MASWVIRSPRRVMQTVKGMLIVGALSLTVLAGGFKGGVKGGDSSGSKGDVIHATGQRDDAGARAAFLAAYPVFMHARCVHCHPVGDAPLQGEDNHPHEAGVMRGSDGHGEEGLKCDLCHQEANAKGPDSPPGVPNWRMPAAEMRMVFQGKSPGDLCRQLKDPTRNGGKTIEGAIEHLAADPLVLWGWDPGEGRSVPSLSHAEFVKKMQEWVAKGGACPQ
ncbi:MAG TPA: hypothetical protein VLZ81_14230 [Blastocatellia bacterium]|nr:hypothetical protein [Blastocatellia bacterium]